jgi:lipopolysaccharide transport system ATP-binding protein
MPSYLQAGIESQSEQIWPDPDTAPGDDRVRMLRARISAPGLAEGEPFDVRTDLRLEFDFLNKVGNASINISVNLYNLEGQHIFNTCSVPRRMPAGVVRNVVQIPGNLLNDGVYRVQALIVRDEGLVLLRMDDVIGFEIADYRESAWHGKIGGAMRPLLKWTVDISPEEFRVQG